MPRQNACICRWTGCCCAFEDIEKLYAHLCDDHIGRKITHNLCLECHWDDCGTTAAKRDHLASHVLVHLPLKPHRCSTCKKAFKRPQDLKKHEKTHTIEHKASLISKQPGYKAIRRRKHTSPANATEDFSSYDSLTETPDKEAFGQGSMTTSPPSSNQGGSSLPTTTVASDGTHRTSPTSVSHPLHNFVNNIVEYNTLSPEYDAEMIDRLEGLASTIHQQPQDWTLPIQDEQDLTTLQLWLEQLSANIGSTAPMYPDLIDAEDMNLYDTNTSSPSQPVDWKNVVYSSENPLTASLLYPHQEKLSCTNNGNLIPSPVTIVDPASLSSRPSFWTPGHSADLNEIKLEDPTNMDGPTPSDSVDFTPPKMVYSSCAQPLHLFESSKRIVETVVAQEAPVPSPPQQCSGEHQQGLSHYPDKRNVVNLLNYMKAPGSDPYGMKPVASAYRGKVTTDHANNMIPYDKELDKLIGMHKGAGPRHKGLSKGANVTTHKKAAIHCKETQTTGVTHYASDHAADHPEKQHTRMLKKQVGGSRQVTVTHTTFTIGRKDLADTPKQETILVSTKEIPKTVKAGAAIIDKSKQPTSLPVLARPILSTSSSSTTMRITLPKEEPSPYADLLEKLRDLNVGEDDGDDKVHDDSVARARHMSLVNRIYDAVLRAQKASAPPTPRKNTSTNTQKPTPNSHNHHHPQELVSV